MLYNKKYQQINSAVKTDCNASLRLVYRAFTPPTTTHADYQSVTGFKPFFTTSYKSQNHDFNPIILMFVKNYINHKNKKNHGADCKIVCPKQSKAPLIPPEGAGLLSSK